MRPHVFATAALILLPLAAASNAQQREAMRFRAMDRNGDGTVSRAEWRGSDQSFRVHDWNGDGVLSGDEVRVGARRNIDELDYDPNTREFHDWTEARFAMLDRNRDGRIAASEWHYDAESFLRADRNGDRVLTRAEFLGNDVDDDRNDRFDYLDMNNNGRIERSEWHGSRDAFTWLDRNRDGVLSRVEVVGEETVQQQDLFTSLDYNQDNRISQDEWQWSRRSFLQRDADRDGVLSRRELGSVAPGAVAPDVVGTTGETIVVDSTVRWTDTGLNVRQGQTIRVNAQGSVQMSDEPSDLADPAGSRTGRRASSAPLPQQPAGALIARIGIDSSAAMMVGDNASLIAPRSGRLYLSVNDDHLGDNRGSYRVTVTVSNR